MLCRVTTIAAFGALGLGLLMVGDERFGRRAVLTRLVVTGIGVLALHALGVARLGGPVARLGGHVGEVVGGRSPMQRVSALVCFVQGFALVLPFAWRRRRER